MDGHGWPGQESWLDGGLLPGHVDHVGLGQDAVQVANVIHLGFDINRNHEELDQETWLVPDPIG